MQVVYNTMLGIGKLGLNKFFISVVKSLPDYIIYSKY